MIWSPFSFSTLTLCGSTHKVQLRLRRITFVLLTFGHKPGLDSGKFGPDHGGG